MHEGGTGAFGLVILSPQAKDPLLVSGSSVRRVMDPSAAGSVFRHSEPAAHDGGAGCPLGVVFARARRRLVGHQHVSSGRSPVAHYSVLRDSGSAASTR